MSHAFYRIIRGPVPTLEDFKSGKLLGKPLRDPNMEREWAYGLSVFDSLDHAAQRARALRFGLGAWVVRLVIPDGSAIEWAQTGKDSRHFTIYTVPFEALTLVEGDAIYVGDE